MTSAKDLQNKGLAESKNYKRVQQTLLKGRMCVWDGSRDKNTINKNIKKTGSVQLIEI